jgi:hypothetical protein
MQEVRNIMISWDSSALNFWILNIYPVTLTISNGDEIATFTQHITVEGSDIRSPVEGSGILWHWYLQMSLFSVLVLWM